MNRQRGHREALTPEDEIIVKMTFSRPGHVARIDVQYRAWIRGRWVEVARYDNAHGVPHVHRFWNGTVRPLRVAPEQLISLAKKDIRDNWARYRALMEMWTP
jgi:hypothetical protein